MQHSARSVVLTGLVGALGLGFPWVFHLLGGGHLGPVFLPMFLPVVAGAFFLPVPLAVLVGLTTPLLSAILTGMPPLAPPVAFLMMGELATMAGVVALLRHHTRLGAWTTLGAAALADRLIIALLAAGLAPAFGLPPAMVTWGALLVGLPGIALMFAAIPPLVSRLSHRAEHAHGMR